MRSSARVGRICCWRTSSTVSADVSVAHGRGRSGSSFHTRVSSASSTAFFLSISACLASSMAFFAASRSATTFSCSSRAAGVTHSSQLLPYFSPSSATMSTWQSSG